MSEKSTPQKKRRFYHNLMDAFRICQRTYPWVGWLMVGVVVVATALGVLAAALTHSGWFSLTFLGFLIGVLIATFILSNLTDRATYAQVGIVLISEGPSSRVRPLLEQERKKAQRLMRNVAITTIQVGTGKGQVRLANLLRELRKLKKNLTRDEVPLVNQRLSALDRRSAPIPKGIDPARARPNRRALRGR